MLSLLQTLMKGVPEEEGRRYEGEEEDFAAVIECQPCVAKTPSRTPPTTAPRPTDAAVPSSLFREAPKKKRCGLCGGAEDVVSSVSNKTGDAPTAAVVRGLDSSSDLLLLRGNSSSSDEGSLSNKGHLVETTHQHHQSAASSAKDSYSSSSSTSSSGFSNNKKNQRRLLRGITEEAATRSKQRCEALVAVSQLGHGSFGRVYLVAERRDAQRVKHRRRTRLDLQKKRRGLGDFLAQEDFSDDDDDTVCATTTTKENLTRAERRKMSALKTIPLATLNSRKKVEHVRYERRVIEMLHGHPNVIELRAAWRCPNALYLLTEVAWGGELFRHLQHARRFEPRQAAFFAAQLASALNFAHSRRIVYRDLKPENVLLDDTGHVKLVDFGLSKILTSPNHHEDLTRGCRSLCGTPEYMSPETLDRREYGQAVDFWALGMLTAELLSGLPPWYTNVRDELFRRIRFEPLDLSPVAQAVAKSASKAAARGCALSAPVWDVATEAADFVGRLLDRLPGRRLGCVEPVAGHPFLRRYGYDVADLSGYAPPYDPATVAAPPPERGAEGLVAGLHTHFHRTPLVSLTVPDISDDVRKADAKALDAEELAARSRMIRTWSYDTVEPIVRHEESQRHESQQRPSSSAFRRSSRRRRFLHTQGGSLTLPAAPPQ